jgi:hypothetical protein
MTCCGTIGSSTAREHSIVTITEVPGVSTVELVSGRISVAVDKARMRRGDAVEIKTPNAVTMMPPSPGDEVFTHEFTDDRFPGLTFPTTVPINGLPTPKR